MAKFFGIDDRRHRRHRDRRGLAGQRHDLRQTVHDSRQVDREADPGLGRRRHLRSLRPTRAFRCRTRTSTSPRTNRATPATTHERGSRPAADDPRRHRQRHQPELLFLARDCRQVTGGAGVSLEYRQLQHHDHALGRSAWSRSLATWTARRCRVPRICTTRIRAPTGTPAANAVKSSTFEKSPRVFPIPLYDPVYWAAGKRKGRYAGSEGGQLDRLLPRGYPGQQHLWADHPDQGSARRGAGPAPEGAFPRRFDW